MASRGLLRSRAGAAGPAGAAGAAGAADPLLWSGEVMARLGAPPPEPAGFSGDGRPGRWRQAWGPWDRWCFDQAAGELLVELGYEPDRAWAKPEPARAAWFGARYAAETRLSAVSLPRWR
ncbi:MAG: hypothetical protein ACRD0L_17560 [Acidimicrobiales bacterium]